MSETEIHLDRTEIWAVNALANWCGDDERLPGGAVHLRQELGRRSWVVDGELATVGLDFDAAGGAVDVALPPRLVRFASRNHTDDVGANLVIVDDAGAKVVTEAASMSVGRGHLVRLPAHVHRPVAEPAASIDVDGAHLRALISAARCPARSVEDHTPLFWLEVDGGRLSVEIDWIDNIGPASYSMAGTGSGRGVTAARPDALAYALEMVEPDCIVTLELSGDGDAPLVLRSGAMWARLANVSTTVERLRAAVEQALYEAFGPLALYRDADGDYPLTQRGVPIYARLIDGSPAALQVFSVLIHDVEASPDLYREVNDLNRTLGFTRLVWVEGQVLGIVDLVAHTLDPDEIRTAVIRLSDLPHVLGDVLTTVFGGTIVVQEAQRWEYYRGTVILAELLPGLDVALTGPDAMDWPANVDECFVITAENPAGIPMPVDVNDRATVSLAADIQRAGGSFVRAAGWASDDSHVEYGFLVWGIDRVTAVRLGRQYGQDAIFAVTREDVELISCQSDQSMSWPRVPVAAETHQGDSVDGPTTQ